MQVRDSALKVVFRPKRALSAQLGQQPPAAPVRLGYTVTGHLLRSLPCAPLPDMALPPSLLEGLMVSVCWQGFVAGQHGQSEPRQNTAEAVVLVQQGAGTTAPPESMEMDGGSQHSPEVAQQSQHEQRAAPGAQERDTESVMPERAAPEGQAGELDRAVAQQAADACLAALHANTGGQPPSTSSTSQAAQEHVRAGVHLSPGGSIALKTNGQQHDTMQTSLPGSTDAPESNTPSKAAGGREGHLPAGDLAQGKREGAKEDVEMPQAEREQEPDHHDPDHVLAKKQKVED